MEAIKCPHEVPFLKKLLKNFYLNKINATISNHTLTKQLFCNIKLKNNKEKNFGTLNLHIKRGEGD